MTTAQLTAITNHCRFAFETMHPRFIQLDEKATVIVTVNSGYE